MKIFSKKNIYLPIFKSSLNKVGIIGSIVGIIADILSPVGPFLSYLFYFSIFITLLSWLLSIILPVDKKNLFRSISFTSLLFIIVFGLLIQLNKGSEKGILADNIKIVSNLQISLNIIDEKVEEINDKIDIVNNKIDQGFNTLADEQDNILNSIEALNNIGDELIELLGTKKINFSEKIKLEINRQLKTKDYTNAVNFFNKRATDYEYRVATDDENQTKVINFLNIASSKVPNTDVGYFARANLKFVEQNDYETAMKLLDSALAVNPKSYLSYYIKFLIPTNTSRVEDLNKAIAINPNSFFLNYTRGNYFLQQASQKEEVKQEEFQSAIIDLYKAVELADFKFDLANVRLLAAYHDSNRWSLIKKLLNKIDLDNVITYVRENFSTEFYIDNFSVFLMLNNDITDISFIKSDLFSETGNVYYGYFPYYPEVFRFSGETFYGAGFLAPKLPLIDGSDIDSNNLNIIIPREGNNKVISEIRNSQTNEMFTVVFRVLNFDGEEGFPAGELVGDALYIEKGIYEINSLPDIENSFKLNLSNKGQVLNWDIIYN